MVLQRSLALLFATGALSVGGAAAQAAPGVAVHVRGSVASVRGQLLTVTSATGPVRVQLSAKTPVVSVIPSDRAHVKDGSFLGIASRPQPDGSQKAMEIVVFPEAARGTGEGSYAWDLPGSGSHSKMTNGTVSRSTMTNGTAHKSLMTNGTVRKTGRSAVTLQYKNGSGIGSQNVTLPANVPVVTFAPGQPSQLTPGAHVFVIGRRLSSGVVTADRVLVGKKRPRPAHVKRRGELVMRNFLGVTTTCTFTTDETPDALGSSLRLPTQREPMRAQIERTLPPIRT